MKACVNNCFNFSLPESLEKWDSVKIQDNSFHVVYKGCSFLATVCSVDFKTKSFVISINNSIYSVALKDRFDDLLDSLGFASTVADESSNNIVAPMPGKVVRVLVSEGGGFCAGDPLLVLEAMKMENIIKAESSGVVNRSLVSAGDIVEKGAVLIEVA